MGGPLRPPVATGGGHRHSGSSTTSRTNRKAKGPKRAGNTSGAATAVAAGTAAAAATAPQPAAPTTAVAAGAAAHASAGKAGIGSEGLSAEMSTGTVGSSSDTASKPTTSAGLVCLDGDDPFHMRDGAAAAVAAASPSKLRDGTGEGTPSSRNNLDTTRSNPSTKRPAPHSCPREVPVPSASSHEPLPTVSVEGPSVSSSRPWQPDGDTRGADNADCSMEVPQEDKASKVPRSRLFADTGSSPPTPSASSSAGRLSAREPYTSERRAAKGPGAKLAAIIAVSKNKFGDSEASGYTIGRPGSPMAQSHCTNALRHSQSEWWVVQNGKDRSEKDDSSSEIFDSDSEGLIPTWCGREPEAPTIRRTPFWGRGFFGPLRRQCSGQRNRYDFGGFDLDLTYVTSRVIAMSFPAKGMEAAYRNPYTDVVRFLKQEHGEHYRIYNLCAEKSHCYNGFPASHSVNYPCADHCPPTLPMLAKFCQDVEEWLTKNEENVVVVHCKAGKGRTGTHICALLVYARAFSSAYEALLWYEVMRGGKRSGVTIPDQIRWVAMLERWLRHRDEGLNSDPMGPPNPHRLRYVRLGPVRDDFIKSEMPTKGSNNAGPSWTEGNSDVTLRIALVSRHDMPHGRSTHKFPAIHTVIGENRMIEVDLLDGPVWEEHDGMLQVVLSAKVPGVLKSKTWTKKLQMWWHHSFLQRRTIEGGGQVLMDLIVPKVWILGLHKDLERHKKAPSDFKFQAGFEEVRRPDRATTAGDDASMGDQQQQQQQQRLGPQILGEGGAVSGGSKVASVVAAASMGMEGIIIEDASTATTSHLESSTVGEGAAMRSSKGKVSGLSNVSMGSTDIHFLDDSIPDRSTGDQGLKTRSTE